MNTLGFDLTAHRLFPARGSLISQVLNAYQPCIHWIIVSVALPLVASNDFPPWRTGIPYSLRACCAKMSYFGWGRLWLSALISAATVLALCSWIRRQCQSRQCRTRRFPHWQCKYQPTSRTVESGNICHWSSTACASGNLTDCYTCVSLVIPGLAHRTHR